MKYLLIIFSSLTTLYFYNYIFDNAALGLLVILLSFFFIFSNFNVDKRYCEFIKNLNEIEYSSIEEALEEFKTDKKYLIRLFSKDNTNVLSKFKKLKFTHKEFDRFVEIQQKKNEFIESCIKQRTKYFGISIIINLLSFIPLLYSKYNNPFFFYKLFNGGYYYILFLSFIFVLVNNYNLFKVNQKNTNDISFLDNYSLCFHKNCQGILNIKDDRLKYDNKGYSVETEFKSSEKSNYFCSFVSLILSILISIYFML